MKLTKPIFATLVILKLSFVVSLTSSENTCLPNENIDIKKGEAINISSPGFEEFHYPSNSLCSWTINSVFESNRRLQVEFLVVSIWPTYNCLFDGVVLFDGNSTAAPMLGKFCAGTPRSNLITTGPQLHVVFYSSDQLNYPFRGFQIQITEIESEQKCSEDEIVCHNKNCIQKILVCNGQDDCGDGTDEESCGYPVRHSVPCGLAPISPDLGNNDRIVGGRAAIPGSWPWQCSLRKKGNSLFGHLCGAALINDQWALTAAHCFRGRNNASLWTVHLGKFIKEKKESTEQVRYIKEIIIHPKYVSRSKIPYLNADIIKKSPELEITSSLKNRVHSGIYLRLSCDSPNSILRI
ncbi:ovochymase-1 [Nephila pilipes]|uniref:Ovochymase-1 n=1 Tax=Nephila pilipes TaxID=299642 RepID=A0A8X6MTA5_NEPPI|nr:ovochymase-1 [Nephila pilipes]